MPVDGTGLVDPDDVRRGDHAPDRPLSRDARQQRGRHDPAHRRDRPRSPARAACSSTPTPPSPSGKIPPGRRTRRRPALGGGAQALRAQGRRRALRPARRAARAVHPRRRPRGGRRAGTENVLLDVGARRGLRTRARTCVAGREARGTPRPALGRAAARFGEACVLNGHADRTAAEHAQRELRSVAGTRDPRDVPEVAASTGSACHSGGTNCRRYWRRWASARSRRRRVRFSLGRETTPRRLERVLELLAAVAPPES